MRRHPRAGVRGLVQLRVRTAGREAWGGALGGHGRTLWLQPQPRRTRCSGKHAAAGRADPGPARHRLDRDRPGRGAGECAGDGDGRRHDRRWRPPSPADLQPPRRARSRWGHVREQPVRCPHRAEPDDRRGARRHRNRRGDPGGDGRGQDGHRRTEDRKSPESCGSAEDEASNTDAWFASFAPAFAPRIVVGVLLVQDGAGGATAAPVARQVLEAGLSASR
jgi:hypothetical protein